METSTTDSAPAAGTAQGDCCSTGSGGPTLRPRIQNAAMLIPEAVSAIQGLAAAIRTGGVPEATLGLVHLRASQINGCSACLYGGMYQAKRAGETDDRLFTVAGWRDSPFFTAPERAALALTEAVTRLADRADPVPDEIWDEAARHYDEKGLMAVLLAIAVTNVFNRINVSTRQVAGVWGG